jgi:DMSO/TMAO reductase YedYZ molybdopterin-dependent catalytic subunit
VGTDAPAPDRAPWRALGWRGLASGALSGLLAAAVALGVAELIAGITGPLGSPVVAVGGAAIDMTPIPVKDFAIVHFGSHDKTALISGIFVLLAIFAVVIGVLARRWLAAGLAGLTIFGALGVSAALTRPTAAATDVLPTLIGVAAGMAALILLIRAARGGRSELGTVRDTALETAQAAERDPEGYRGLEAAKAGTPDTVDHGTDTVDHVMDTVDHGTDTVDHGTDTVDHGTDTVDHGPDTVDHGPDTGPGQRLVPGRRGFLAAGAGMVVVAAAAGAGGDLLLRRFSATTARNQVRLPAAAKAAPALPADAKLDVSGISSFYTPNNSFYRVDTDLVLPQVSPDQWTLQISGMVDRPVELSFADLLRQPLTEADITLVCVSNEVGGPYAGNARWLGASLPALLRRAGVRSGADQLLSTSVDGMTISTPVSAIMDGRNAVLAVGMNGQPLPIAHGFPARMVVPGLYGYTSATKWITKLELTTFAAQKAYWTQRGYAAQAPIKTESRIDVPKPLSQVSKGQVAVAGVAWAPHRGISAVEVSVDNGAWHEARLAAADGIDTWRQWVWNWDAAPGLHQLQVRATDGTGATQTSSRTGVFPSGATGWDSVVVTVT